MIKSIAAGVLVSLVAAGAWGAVLRVPHDHDTLEAALAAASAGDTLLLAPGTYVIDGKLEIAKTLTLASNYIDSGRDEDISATILKAGPEARQFWVDIGPQAKDTRIVGLTFAGNGRHSLAIRNPYSVVSHCRFVGGNDQLSFEGGGGLVAHCHFEGAGDDAIDADNSVSWTVEHCTIKQASDDGIEVRLHAKDGPVTTHIVRYSTFDDCKTGVQLIDYPGDSHRRFEVHHNLFTNIRNTAFDCTVHTSDGNTDGSPMVERAVFFNNTVDACRNGVTLAPNVVVLNSIFTNAQATGIIKGKHVGAGDNSVVDHCLFFGNALDHDDGLTIGQHLVSADPRFRNTTTYELSPGSPAVDRGAARYTFKGADVLNLPAQRFTGTAPDLGARELAENRGEGKADRLELIRHVNLWTQTPIRSPDSSGLTYHAPSGRLIIVDSEISEYADAADKDGKRIFSGRNVFEVSLDLGKLFESHFAGPREGLPAEPTGIAYNPKDGHVYVTDDDQKKIFRYRFDGQRKFGPPVAEASTSVGGAYSDPEGITCDPATGILYVVSGTKQERVLKFRFDADAGSFVHLGEFAVAAHIRDPEGIGIDPDTGNLFLVSTSGIAEFKQDGAFVQFFDYGFFDAVDVAATLPGGLTFAPSSDPDDPPQTQSIYLSHRGIDNGAFPGKNTLDGAVSEVRLIRRAAISPARGG